MGADKVVGWVCIFVAGWLGGTWVTPEPKSAACVEIPRKPVSYPATKREMQQFIKAYHRQGEGVVR
jgi:hypothetical protein